MKRYIAAFALYLGVTLIVTYPLVTSLSTQLIGHPFTDATEYVHHIWWIKHALQTGQSPFFQPVLLYPDGLSAAWLWGSPLQSFPAWLFAFVVPLPAAFNLSALITLALNGTAMFALAKHLIGSLPLLPRERELGGEVAFLSGLIFMLYPTFQGHLAVAHTGLLTLWGVPLLLLALFRLRENRRYILIGAALFAVSLWGNMLVLIYLIAPILAGYMVLLLARRDWLSLRHTLFTVILGGLFAAPFILPLLRETAGSASEGGVVRYSASLLGIVSPSFYHPIFGALDYPRRVLGLEPFEGASYIGMIAAALCVIGLLKRRESRWWAVVALIAWVFSLGSLLKLYDAPLTVQVGDYASAISLPAAILQVLPVLNIARTPGRFNFAVGFAVAIMADYGASILSSWIRPPILRRIALIVIAALIAFEYQFFFPLPTVDATIPDAITALADRTDIRAVFSVPFEHPLVDKQTMYLQTGYQQAMIAGHITRRTPLDPAKGWLLQTFDPALLDFAGVDIVILHREWDEPALETTVRDRLGVPSYEDERFILFEIAPYTGEPPTFTWISHVADTVTDSAAVYFFAPASGDVILNGRISADNRGAVLSLDGVPLVTWTVNGEQGWNLPITFREAGFHTLELSIDPACVSPNDPALICRPLHVDQLELRDYRPFTSP